MSSRFKNGGLESRFTVTRLDGKPCRPEARYMVLDCGGADPHAIKAMRCYAESVKIDNPQFSDDLTKALDNGWPISLAQHADAK